MAAARSDLVTTKNAGATVLRIAFGWDAMEPEPGKFDWSFWDDFVRVAAEENLTLIPYICYTPRWAASDQGENSWRSPPRNPDEFGRFVAALVQRYRDTIRTWELWNEPDNPAYWSGTVAQMAALIRAGSRAVRAADPTARVVLGGIATELPFLEALFRQERIAPYIDVVNLHSYFETWHPEPIERLPDYLDDAAEIVRVHGEDEPLWLAETGYSSVGPRPVISEVYRAIFQGEHTESAQAAALVRTFLLGLNVTKMELFAWYRINDLIAAQNVIGDDNNRHLGVRRIDGSLKPAHAAFRQLAQLFTVTRFRPAKPEVHLAAPANSPAIVRTFELEDGRVVIGAWLARPPGKSTLSPAPDGRRAEATLFLRRPASRTLKTTTASGQPADEKARWSPERDGVKISLHLARDEVLVPGADRRLRVSAAASRRPELPPIFAFPAPAGSRPRAPAGSR